MQYSHPPERQEVVSSSVHYTTLYHLEPFHHPFFPVALSLELRERLALYERGLKLMASLELDVRAPPPVFFPFRIISPLMYYVHELYAPLYGQCE